MAKRIDPEIQENVERGSEQEESSAGTGSGKNNCNDDSQTKPGDTIKNANAAGLGAIGRNDQNLAGNRSKDSADEGDE